MKCVITGVAWSTCLGDDIATVWKDILDGRSGLIMQDFVLGKQRTRVLAGSRANSDHVDLVADAVSVIVRALADAGLTPAPTDQLVLGTSLGEFDTHRDPAQLAAGVAAALELDVPPVMVSTACATGADVLALACDLVRTGRADRVVAAAVDRITPAKVVAQQASGMLSSTTKLRPFAEDRDGTAVADGAAAVVVESGIVAQSRRHTPRALFLGSASGLDPTSLTAGDDTGTGLATVVKRALTNANVTPADITVVSAHATSTVLNDLTEARALNIVFAPETTSITPTVLATKPALGHTLGAAGLIELIALALALESGQFPPVLTAGALIPELTLPLAGEETPPPKRSGEVGLKVSVGFGGALSAVVLGRADTAFSGRPAGLVAESVELGVAERTVTDLASVKRLLPRMYADPVAWLVAAVVRDVLAKVAEVAPADRALIVVSKDATSHTLRAVVSSAATDGFVSPQRFAAVSASSVAAVVAMTNPVSGQRVTLVMAPGDGLAAASTLTDAWLAGPRPLAHQVVLCTHDLVEGRHLVRCSVWGASSGEGTTPRTVPAP